jgi:hypothetical protein
VAHQSAFVEKPSVIQRKIGVVKCPVERTRPCYRDAIGKPLERAPKNLSVNVNACHGCKENPGFCAGALKVSYGTPQKISKSEFSTAAPNG